MLAVGAATGVLIAAMIVFGFMLYLDSETESATAADEDNNVVRRKLKPGRQRPRGPKVAERTIPAPRATATPTAPGIFDFRGSTKSASLPGKLSLNCRPACDSIVAAGSSLGPSPVFSHPMPPGVHRVTLKGNGKTKTIMVEITSGQLTTQTVSMK